MASDNTDLWTQDNGAVALNGRKCTVCGLVLFPPQTYGCPGCGALPDKLVAALIPASGRLHSFAVVNLHQRYPTPYTIGEIELEDGPLIRGLIDDPSTLHINDRVAGEVRAVEGEALVVFSRAKGGASK